MLTKYWQVFWHLRRISVMRMMEFRADFFFWTGVAVMWTIFNFFYFELLLNVTGQMGGWTRWELYLLLSVFTMLDAFTWSWMAQNMWAYTTDVFSGELSQLLLKPFNPQFLIMIRDNSLDGITRFVVGLGMLIFSARQLGLSVRWEEVMGFMILLSCGALLIYLSWFVIATCAFWVERLDNINEVIPALRRIWQVPRSVYTGLSSVILTVIIPLGLVTSLPSETLLGKGVWSWSIYLVIMTLVVWWFSRWFFALSIKKYTGVAN